MKPHRRKKLGIILFIAAGLSVAVGFTAYALKQNINMFYTPTQVAEGEVGAGQHFRIGGMVKTGTVLGAPDRAAMISLRRISSAMGSRYEGILPDLFREGQGIVAEGEMDAAGVFQASRVLAKHDENFMSPEVKAALDAAGASADNHMPAGTN